MNALPESATNKPVTTLDTGRRILVCAPNWLGDTLMAMPAVRALIDRRLSPDVTVLSHPALATLWRLFCRPVRVLRLEHGWLGTRRTVQRLRTAAFHQAMILPNSFRSAWLPFAARIPVRRGFAGHQRRLLLTQTVRHPAVYDGIGLHQCHEYAVVAGVPGEEIETSEPLLMVPSRLRMAVTERWGARILGHVLLLFPGAARGPSKQWPSASFVKLGRRWLGETEGTVLIAGTRGEHALCETIRREIGGRTVNLAGRTTLPELTALLTLCSVAVGNDSGGTHLAAALAIPVVTIFGRTNPAVTGPRGKHVRIIAAPTPVADRRIARRAPDAEALLAAISVDTVFEATLAVMNTFHHQG